MSSKEIDYTIRIDLNPFVKAMKNVRKAIHKLFVSKYVSYGRAPNIGPGTDI